MNKYSNPAVVLNFDAGKLQVDDNGIYYLDHYTPYWTDREAGVRNEGFTSFSGKILDVKESKPNGILSLSSRLNPLINMDIPICIVPPSDPERSDSGMMKLSQLLIHEGRIDATSCLQRIEKISKLVTGGDRNVETHLRTIRVINPELIKNKHVLLLDDVTTTGNSLFACKKKLLDAGASDVTCFALRQNYEVNQILCNQNLR